MVSSLTITLNKQILTAITTSTLFMAIYSTCYAQIDPIEQAIQIATLSKTTTQSTAQLPTQPNYNSFNQWKNDFATRTIQQGYSADAVNRLLAHVVFNQRIVALDGNQAEFAKMPWEYVDSAVSDARVSSGQRHFAQNRSLLRQIEAKYGVDAQVIAGIWGMESAYGAVTGNADLASSLATLAYEGRRRDFAEKQLLALLQLLQRGDVRWGYADGSWAGGMGHTQFIPTTWLTQGVDADADGRINPWAKADALSSTANYLRNSGWVRGLAPFYEVVLPDNFNYSLVGKTLSFSQWQRQGVRALVATPDNNAMLELWLPAGKNGAALLLSQNFEVIKVYNNSASYALGVSLLGKAIVGENGLQTPWPRYEQPLSRSQVTQLQQLLTKAGYNTHGVDGVIGSNTRKAFSRWQADNGIVPDGFVSQRSVKGLLP